MIWMHKLLAEVKIVFFVQLSLDPWRVTMSITHKCATVIAILTFISLSSSKAQIVKILQPESRSNMDSSRR